MREAGVAVVSHDQLTTVLTTTMTTVGLLHTSTYTTTELVSCPVVPSACAYGSEGWEFESLRARSLPATRFSGAVVASVRNQVGRVVFFVWADTSWGGRS
jgi:hypothetical protein